jgi:hypothetical protein
MGPANTGAGSAMYVYVCMLWLGLLVTDTANNGSHNVTPNWHILRFSVVIWESDEGVLLLLSGTPLGSMALLYLVLLER